MSFQDSEPLKSEPELLELKQNRERKKKDRKRKNKSPNLNTYNEHGTKGALKDWGS